MDSTHTHAGNVMLKISLQKNKIKMHKKSKIKKIPINAEKKRPPSNFFINVNKQLCVLGNRLFQQHKSCFVSLQDNYLEHH